MSYGECELLLSGAPVTDPYGRSAVTDEAPRCWRCNRILALSVTRPWAIRCSRCKAENRHE